MQNEILPNIKQNAIKEKTEPQKIQSQQPDKEALQKISSSPPKVQKSSLIKTVRCFSCREKLGMFGISCKCGHVYCSQHRMPEDHSCTYDFKSQQKQILEKQNPKVAGSKLEKI